MNKRPHNFLPGEKVRCVSVPHDVCPFEVGEIYTVDRMHSDGYVYIDHKYTSDPYKVSRFEPAECLNHGEMDEMKVYTKRCEICGKAEEGQWSIEYDLQATHSIVALDDEGSIWETDLVEDRNYEIRSIDCSCGASYTVKTWGRNQGTWDDLEIVEVES